MSLIQNLKEKSKKIKRELKAVYLAYKDPRVGVFPKFMIMLALGYALSPIDLIPDFIPVIGLLDDIIIVPFLMALAIGSIPEDLMRECREKAETETVDLKKNWITAFIFIAIWIFLFYALARYIFKF